MAEKKWLQCEQKGLVLWHRIHVPYNFFLAVVIIAAAWYAFLNIVAYPSVDTTPALIMVWASVVILLFALFPQLLNKVKRVKMKDFELELQDTVAKAITKHHIPVSELDNHIFSSKGDLRNLGKVLREVVSFPERPALLVVNLKDGNYISIPVLFIYLILLDILGTSVTVLFISSENPIRNLDDIRQSHIVGAVSSRKVIHAFLNRFPYLYRIFDHQEVPGNGWFADEYGSVFSDALRHKSFENIDGGMFSEFVAGAANLMEEGDRLSEGQVKKWFGAELSTHAIDDSISASDVKSIRLAIAEEDEFILVLKGERLSAVIPTGFLTGDIARKALQDLEFNLT